MYLGATRFPVLSNIDWWDEKRWSAEDFGRPFDFSRSFFEQWSELRDSVPRPALNTVSGTIENSDFCNNALSLKDCYFCFDADRSRDCLYVETLADCADCLDCSSVVGCELCYDCVGCTNCYSLQSSDDCTDCSNSWYLSGCKSCTSCFGCTNLRQKRYCVYNKQLSKAEFEAFLGTMELRSWTVREAVASQFAAFRRTQPRPHLVSARSENVTGNHIYNSRNAQNCFQIHNGEDLCHCDIMKSGGKSCHDCTISFVQPELMYECAICGLSVFNLAFCYNCWDGAADLLYCDSSHGSKHCFGCVGLRKRSYCILNKQYTESEYHTLAAKIIEHMRTTGEWGEFFPMSISPWPYNASLASRYFPLTESEARNEGLSWHTIESDAASELSSQPLTDLLPDVDDSIVTRCCESGRLFRITHQEIRRLRRFSAPLPRCAYDKRMDARAKRSGELRLQERTCARSGQSIETAYGVSDYPVILHKDVFDREFE